MGLVLTRASVAAAGALALFLAAVPTRAAGGTPELCEQLFTEGRWAECRLECRRVLAGVTAEPRASLLRAISETRLGLDATVGLRAVEEQTNAPPAARALARYELGRAYWRAGQETNALAELQNVFTTTTERPLFLRAGCALAYLLDDSVPLTRAHPALVQQLVACRTLWSPALHAECRSGGAPDRTAWTGRPAEWMIAVYRTQISPAIGRRCSLTPSCSAYALEALRRHGALGLGLAGDRMWREPDVVMSRAHPVRINDRVRYSDPLDDHDYWLRGVQP